MLDLKQLKELKQGDDDWSKLVLPDGHKKMVQAMVEMHARGSREPGWGASTNHQGRVSLDLVQGMGMFPRSGEGTMSLLKVCQARDASFFCTWCQELGRRRLLVGATLYLTSRLC